MMVCFHIVCFVGPNLREDMNEKSVELGLEIWGELLRRYVPRDKAEALHNAKKLGYDFDYTALPELYSDPQTRHLAIRYPNRPNELIEDKYQELTQAMMAKWKHDFMAKNRRKYSLDEMEAAFEKANVDYMTEYLGGCIVFSVLLG